MSSTQNYATITLQIFSNVLFIIPNWVQRLVQLDSQAYPEKLKLYLKRMYIL